jgi:hypothetical protein
MGSQLLPFHRLWQLGPRRLALLRQLLAQVLPPRPLAPLPEPKRLPRQVRPPSLGR